MQESTIPHDRPSSPHWLPYGAGLAALAVLVVLSVSLPPPAPPVSQAGWWISCALWMLLLVMSGSLAFNIAGGILSLNSLLVVTGLMIFGLVPALWITALGMILADVVYSLLADWLGKPPRTAHRTLVVAATNMAMQVFSLVAAWLAFTAVGGHVPLDDFSTRTILALGVLFLAYFLTNNLLFSLDLKIEQGVPIGQSLFEDWQMVLLVDLLPLPLGIVIAHIYVKLGSWTFAGVAIYLLIGMVMMYFLDRAVASQAAIAQENAQLVRERERRITDLSILNEISRSLSSALDLDELLEMVHGQVSRIFDTTNFYIAIYEASSDEWYAPFHLENGQRQPVIRYKLGAGLTGYIIRNCRPILLRSRAESQAFKAAQGVPLVGEPSTSWMGIPLMAADEVIGVMAIQSYKQENLYTEHDLELFSTVGAQLAIAIRNARLYTETQHRANEAVELSSTLQAALDAQSRLVATIRELGAPLIPVAEGIVVLPLIGHIDQPRAQTIMENLLAGIDAHQAEVVLIDITGVPTVDTMVANSLLQAARAARMLGARVLLVGVRPEVAQTIVNLGIDLGGLTNFANLQTGVEAALRLRGFRITRG